MTITDRTRKILWARSGNRCAMCKRALVEDATDLDVESVIGEECHVIAERDSGPRHDSVAPDEGYDSAANLLLLCRNHHKLVDDQRQTFTVEVLRSLKVNHEQWVADKLGEAPAQPVRVVRVPGNVPTHLSRLDTGKALMAVLDGALGFQFSNDDLVDQVELAAVSSFLQQAQDWGDLLGEFEAGQRVEATFNMGELIRELEDSGFWVFGGREVRVLQGGGDEPSPFPIAILEVVRSSNLKIRAVDLDWEFAERTVEFEERKPTAE